MRLPTIMQHRAQNRALSQQFDRLGYLQNQAISEKKILRSSENPMLADNIKAVRSHLTRLNSFDNNIALAQNRQNQKESAANQGINNINRVQELLIKAMSETNNGGDLKNISKEIEGILTQFIDLANSRDANDEYIFSGLNINTPAFRKAGNHYVYQGSDETRKIAIGIDIKTEYSDSGYEVFGNIPTGNGYFEVGATNPANTGTGNISSGSMIDFGAYVQDEYTLSVVTNSAGNPACVVTGINSGQIIPTPPDMIPDDAPDYVSGQDIAFNGISVQLSGQPNSGDTFTIKPSQKQDIFSSLSTLIQVLNQPNGSDVEKANIQQNLSELKETLNQAGQHFIEYAQKTGNQGIMIDNQKKLADNLKLNEEILMQSLSAPELEKVLTELSAENMALQLTQKIYSQLEELQMSMLMNR